MRHGSTLACTQNVTAPLLLRLLKLCDPAMCRKGVPKKRRKAKKAANAGDGSKGVSDRPAAIAANPGPTTHQELAPSSMAAVRTSEQHGSGDAPAVSPACSRGGATSGRFDGCRHDIIAEEHQNGLPAANGAGVPGRDAPVSNDGRPEPQHSTLPDTGQETSPAPSVPSTAVQDSSCACPGSRTNGTGNASARWQTEAVDQKPPVSGRPPACRISGSAVGHRQPAAASPAAVPHTAASDIDATRRLSGEGASPTDLLPARNGHLPQPAPAVGDSGCAVTGLRPASSEEGESHTSSEPRRAAAAAGGRRGHARSLSRVSVGSTVSSCVSEQPLSNSAVADSEVVQEAAEAVRRCLAEAGAEASEAVGSVHLFERTLGA